MHEVFQKRLYDIHENKFNFHEIIYFIKYNTIKSWTDKKPSDKIVMEIYHYEIYT